MTSAHRSGRGLGLTIGVFVLAVAATILVVTLVGSWSAGPSPTTGGEATTGSTSPAPTARVDCTEEPGPLARGLSGDACPSAILAVELAVAPVRLPIVRIVIEPGPFFCDVLWPGAASSPPCYGPAVRPGQFMHAWAGFSGSPKVAVVALGLNLPPDIDGPGTTRPPWRATLVTVAIPPDGWVMP